MHKKIYTNVLRLILCTLFSSSTIFAQNPGIIDNRPCQEDGVISLAFSGDTIINTCTDDEVTDRLRFQVRPFRQAFAYVVVDEGDIIRSIGFSNFINFDLLPTGTLRVYAFSNYGRITAQVGDTFSTATLSRPCAGLTTNFVTVNNGMSGDIVIESEQDTYTACVGDDVPDVITFSSPANNVFYIITSPDGEVHATNETGVLDVDSAPSGICYIYAFANPGGITIAPGENISVLADIMGCGIGLSTNFITLNRIETTGGTILTADGQSSVQTCPGDGNDDLIDFVATGGTGENNRLIVTDENNVIIGLPDGNTVNFEGAETGVCHAWNLTYYGDFTAEMGQDIFTAQLASSCFSLSDTFVEVRREVPVGGTVLTTDGASEVETCPGDGIADVIDVVSSGASGGTLVYLITDENNELLSSNTEPSFDVEGAGVGNCHIFVLSYQGNLTLTPGVDITMATDLADNCFALSTDYVNVVRTVPNAGTVATDAGETEITTCPGDGLSDVVTFASMGADAGANFVYLVTDSDNNLLMVVDGNSTDFEGAGLGICRVWGLSYAGDLLVAEGDNLNTTTLASACFALSDNFITVNRVLPEGGTVQLSTGATMASVCPGDGVADILRFVSEGASGPNFAFVITDNEGNILGFPASASVNFDEVPPGICRVYGLSYYGDILAGVGADINGGGVTSGCYSLSGNFITVTRQSATTGPISTEDGATEIIACPGDAFPDVFRFDSTGTSLTNFNYLVTDTFNVVLFVAFTDRIDFEQLPEGVCRVHGLGYDGVVVASPGDTAGVDQLATQCYALSENFVTVTKELPVGGALATINGETYVSVCSMDGVADLVEVVSSGAVGSAFTFVLTSEDNVILDVSTDPVFDFDAAPFGVCRIWGLSYQGELLATAGVGADTAMLASGCFDLSGNFVTVTKGDVLGGMVSLTSGATAISTCPGDGVADLLDFANSGASGSSYQYLVTTENNVILALVDGNSFDFEPAGAGVCRVWGFAYEGNVTAMAGDTASLVTLADGCFALSDNYITVTRETPVGGSISLADGTNLVQVCSGVEGEPTLNFVTTSPNVSYTYLIVQQDSFILTSIPDSFNFNRAQGGVYEIYGLAYTGDLTIFPGQNLFNTDLASSCFERSDTSITVVVTEVDGGVINGNGAEELYFCVANQDDGFVRFATTSSEVDGSYRYVITTASAEPVILAVIEADSFEFGSLPLMELRVYGICFSGDFVAGPGFSLLNSPLATGCVDISDNYVTVFNDTPEAGTISSADLPATGISCTVDGDGTISVSTTSTSATGYAVIVTDTFNVVQLVAIDRTNVDLGSLPEGPYRIWGLAYTGNVTVQPGDDILNSALADNCFELTATYLDVIQGGSISAGFLTNLSTEGTGDTIQWCIADGDNPIAVVEGSVSGPNYRYIVTDVNGRVRAANLPSNIIPFRPFGPGEYRIYGFNYTGMSLVGINQNINTSLLSTECAALTSNYITVIYVDPDGGTVTTTDGATEIEIEISGSGADATAIIAFETTSDSLDNFVYVITDENNQLMAVSQSNVIDFGPSGVGVCRVWGLAYTGEIIAGLNDDALTTELTDGCYALSDNFVEVTRVDEVGLDDGPGRTEAGGIIASLQLTARPNPTSGGVIYLDIESFGAMPGGVVYVRDINGTAYSVQPLVSGGNATTLALDISMLPAGMYFAQVATQEGLQSVRFMKQ